MNLLTIFCYYNKKEKNKGLSLFHISQAPQQTCHICVHANRMNKKNKQTNTELCSDEYFQNLIRILGFSTVRQLEIDSEWKEVSTAAFEITKT